MCQDTARLLGQVLPQCLWFQDTYTAPPTEQPWKNLALLAYSERYQQSLRRFFFAYGVEGARFANPASDRGIEKRADDDVAHPILLIMVHFEITRTLKRFGLQFQVLHAVEAKMTDVPAQMAVASHIPAIEGVKQAIGVNFADLRGSMLISAMPCMIGKTGGRMINECAAQFLQHLLLIWSVFCIGGDEMNVVLQVVYIIAELFRQDAGDFTTGGLSGGTILSIEVVCHIVTAQEQHCCLFSGEAEGRQEIPLH